MFKDYVFIDINGDFGEAGREYNFNSLDDETCENIGYYLELKEQRENDLIEWIADAQREISRSFTRKDFCQKLERDILLMKEDLKTLFKYDDEFIFSSMNDNEYLIQSQCDEAEAYWKRQGSKGNYHAFNEVLKQFVRALQEKEAKEVLEEV